MRENQMRFSFHKIIVPLLFIAFCSSTAFGDSNFDFFFKNTEEYKDVVVESILSADTLRLKGKVGEKGETVKLIGLRAPKAPKKKTEDIKRDQFGFVKKEPVSPLTPIEERAFKFAQDLLKNQHVRLEFDANKKTEDHATLAYVFLLEEDLFVNAEILRHGYAHLSIRPPNTKYAKELREAYREARAEQRGLQGE